MPWWGWVLIGLGVIGFVVLKYFGVSAFMKRTRKRRGSRQILDD